eukprot:TRINITY_DN9487_c0_g1_i1.p1 TRINITY_DN9487_c0_g1~~TRINITY_DN9487_c0_g1_i1.p1  ORF type:complete len:151 (+),score=31.79 TRINITY_DN9487_c0_g1_i1:294-746(+)
MSNKKEIEWSGYLTKQGNTVKNWKKRWFLLDNGVIHYFKGKEDTVPLYSVQLSECSVSLAPFGESKRKCCLKLHAPKRTWYFAAETEDTILEFMEAVFSWGVPESSEEDEVITSLYDCMSQLSSATKTVYECTVASGSSSDIFRDSLRTA